MPFTYVTLQDQAPKRLFPPWGTKRGMSVRFRRLGNYYFHRCILSTFDELKKSFTSVLDSDEAVDTIIELKSGRLIRNDDDLEEIEGFDFQFTVKDGPFTCLPSLNSLLILHS